MTYNKCIYDSKKELHTHWRSSSEGYESVAEEPVAHPRDLGTFRDQEYGSTEATQANICRVTDKVFPAFSNAIFCIKTVQYIILADFRTW